VTLPLYDVRKCPYLAGRPPCGTHHLFPSGANVCWATTREGGKPYLGIERELQDRHCFGGPEGQDSCECYRSAVAASVPLPRFERPPAGAPAGPEWALPPRPKPHRLAEIGASPLKSHLAWLVPLILTGLLLALGLR
jgi:hypothetical protein